MIGRLIILNNNFFSKDTIFSRDYENPQVNLWEYQKTAENSEILVGYRVDKNLKYKLVIQTLKDKSNGELTIDDEDLLDGYWNRLSKEVVLNGAGALNLFLQEAERAKEEYANKPQTKLSFWALFLGMIGIGDTSDNINANLSNVDNNDNSDRLVTQPNQDGITSVLPLVSPILSPSPTVSPKPSPSLTPKISASPSVSPIPSPTPKLSTTEKININTANKELLMTLKGIKDAKSDAIILHRQTHGPFQKIEDIMNVSGIGPATFEEIKGLITVGDIVQTPTPVPTYGGGGGSSSPTPTPTPSPSVTPIPSPTPEPDGDIPLGTVVINEIAWMGTSASLSSDEWMELYNTTNQTVDLTGWTLKSLTGASPDPQITLTGSIGPFGFFLLERTDNTTISDILAGQTYTGALSDSGETLELRDASGALQDKVSGDSGWYAGNKDTRSAMERVNPKQSGNDSTNWSTNNSTTKNGLDAAGNPINGTPKAPNSVYVALQPSAVTDLAANVDGANFTLTWSVPGDGDTLSASLSYDIRYSADNFDDSDDVWDEALKLASASTPAVAEEGASESASFDIAYGYGQKWYFALKTKVIHIPTCDVGNVDNCEGSDISDISNIVDATTKSAVDDSAWAMLGKDALHTSFADFKGPKTTATIRWEFSADPGNAISQPVADAAGNIYFGAADGASGKLFKLAENGSKSWEFPTNVSIGTPAVLSDGTVYFGRVGAGGVLAFTALNPDGSKKWDYDDASTVKAIAVSSKGEPHFTYSSGTDNLAVLNPDRSVKTLVSNTGLSGFTPVVLENGNIIATRRNSGNQFFNAYSADGTQLWAEELFYTGANGSIQSNPSYDLATGNIYSAIGYDGGSSFGFRIFVIPPDGSVLNTTVIDPANNGSAATMVSVTPTNLLVGLDYSWFNPSSGSKLFSLNKSDLTISWSFRAEGKINQQIAVDKEGNAYFSTQSGHIYSVFPDGLEMWHVSTGVGSNVSPVLLKNGVIWGYGSRIVLVN